MPSSPRRPKPLSPICLSFVVGWICVSWNLSKRATVAAATIPTKAGFMRRASYRLNAEASKGVEKMRIFCPEHKKGFFAPRQNPIKCENRGHILGEFNFAGSDRSQVALHWQYCCNCEHFSPISPQGESLQRCPVCTRPTSLLFICDRCFITSYESNTPLRTKNFTLTSEGLPQPSCPGCLQANSGEVR